jgi:hypothetical protein
MTMNRCRIQKLQKRFLTDSELWRDLEVIVVTVTMTMRLDEQNKSIVFKNQNESALCETQKQRSEEEMK